MPADATWVAMGSAKRRVKRRRKPVRCAPSKPRKRRAKSADLAGSEASAARKRRRKPVRCRPAKRRRRPKPTPPAPRPPLVATPVPRPPAPPPPAPVPPPPAPVPGPDIDPPTPIHTGGFGLREAQRLLWRAGFGPSPGHAEALAAMGLEAAVLSLTRPAGPPTLTGAEPVDGDDGPLHPADAWGHDHLWFFDRMVRTDQPLMERMTLIWHDWFATSIDGAAQSLLLEQNETLRANALGSFDRMALDVTADPAMILWLNQNENSRWSPNENYARELMELFTLGADRGAYTEDDVRELARALTGWRSDWSSELGDHNFRYDASRHDGTSKTVFGKTGDFGWEDGIRLCLDHPLHASYFVQKLWSYFIPVPPSATDRLALEEAYVASGGQVRPVVEAILVHPQLYAGPRMVKPPVVYAAGMLRGQRRPVDTGAWVWLGELAGQRLFRPPSVAGWDAARWLDTSTLRGRWLMVSELLHHHTIPSDDMDEYDPDESPELAVQRARDWWADPALTAEGLTALTGFAATCLPAVMADWQQSYLRGLRQNALRQLLAVSPDLQTA